MLRSAYHDEDWEDFFPPSYCAECGEECEALGASKLCYVCFYTPEMGSHDPDEAHPEAESYGLPSTTTRRQVEAMHRTEREKFERRERDGF